MVRKTSEFKAMLIVIGLNVFLYWYRNSFGFKLIEVTAGMIVSYFILLMFISFLIGKYLTEVKTVLSESDNPRLSLSSMQNRQIDLLHSKANFAILCCFILLDSVSIIKNRNPVVHNFFYRDSNKEENIDFIDDDRNTINYPPQYNLSCT